jgi:hypothetical protein
MLKLLLRLLQVPAMYKQKPPTSLAELRPNTGAAPAFAVAHQAAFPWLNTVACLPATSALENGPDQLAGPLVEAI